LYFLIDLWLGIWNRLENWEKWNFSLEKSDWFILCMSQGRCNLGNCHDEFLLNLKIWDPIKSKELKNDTAMCSQLNLWLYEEPLNMKSQWAKCGSGGAQASLLFGIWKTQLTVNFNVKHQGSPSFLRSSWLPFLGWVTSTNRYLFRPLPLHYAPCCLKATLPSLSVYIPPLSPSIYLHDNCTATFIAFLPQITIVKWILGQPTTPGKC
jgi:hypothetical protein